MESASSKRGSHTPEPSRTKKRAKYTQVACNECKRRKLKCGGEPVCSRCLRDNVRCVYTPNAHAVANTASPSLEDPVKDDRLSSRLQTVDQQIETLQREMRHMAARLRQLESTSVATPANNASILTSMSTTSSTSANVGLQRILNRPKSPTYVGPTSAEFGLTGRQKPSEDSDGDADESDSAAAPSPAPAPESEAVPGDSLRCLGLTETLRLVTVYEHTVGLIYPCVDLDSVRAYVVEYFRDEGDGPNATTPNAKDQDWFFARDAEVLKIIVATALLAESHGRSERAAWLADSVEDKFATRYKMPEVDMKELLILTLVSIFHSYRDDEVIAWRTIGSAVRGSVQLGLHCQETWLKTGGVFPGELHRTWASRLFWCIYVLDRKWSFGTGLPFAIQDSDMDTNLPEPGTATPYLTCMISYARLSSKIWGLVVGWRTRPRAATADYCSYLDFQVQQWIQSIPPELRFDPSQRSSTGSNPQADSMMMLQVLLALQANQLRILVYRQYLFNAESIEESVPSASIAVETAKTTVHMLDFFSRVSDIYFQRPEPFNYFLISALAALFLAVLHSPSRFSQVCRPEFYKAVDMVRRSSTRSRTSRRLQKIIRSLKLIRLNLGSKSPGQTNPTLQQPFQHPKLPAAPTSEADYSMSFNPMESPYPQHHHHHHQLSNLPTPQPSALWSFATPTDAAPVDQNSCEDLTSFFEMAGGFYFDPRTQAEVAEGVVPEAGTDGAGIEALNAEDEALTRVMAGLL
ncbi:fungal-specific transcription factor domain protein [Aspergillus sclerotioniger CBS 115572]|uniref:Fungal-specific transcription factor domain protein n=1 Tax=Aspergillus sclerotioniger CBS 115572 TaxID=1450535 RepID=A0A317WJJ1_9EURO|nr:fungal-specific transcription factor domain protein [Aspergillus sclerotioniger CBS 115572]PWY86624.1 fungal-specific transcription factor domain protein [Aspergillus sclerotioniger CBS 115572]